MNYRDFIVEMVEEGSLDCKTALIMCLKAMSLDDVKDTIEINYLDVDGDLEGWMKQNGVS